MWRKGLALTVGEGDQAGPECSVAGCPHDPYHALSGGGIVSGMSATLNQPLGTVKNSLFRARKHLKTILLKKGLLEV